MFSSIRELTNKIVEIESSNKLFEWKIDGIFIWEIIRYQVYSTALHVNFKNEPNIAPFFSRRAGSFFRNLAYKFQKHINAILHHPYFDRKTTEVLVFESSRKLLFNDKYIDPYTEFTCQELKEAKKSLTKYQSSYAYDRLAKSYNDTKSIDLPILISGIKARFLGFKPAPGDLEEILRFGKILNKELNIEINFKKLIKREIMSFKLSLIFFRALLSVKKPKEIYLVNFCDKSALIAAAKEVQVLVTDIQHGLISSDDIIYNYPGVKEGTLHYFPDRFFAWSKIWAKLSKLPLKDQEIVDYGNKFLEHQKTRFRHIAKDQRQLIIISQPGLTNLIANEVLKHLKSFEGFRVLYKLHPAEYGSAFNYNAIEKLSREKNFTFVKRNEDLYSLLAASLYVIGLGSTVLIEALSFDCNVLLLNLPGVEWMMPFIDGDRVKMFEPGKSLVAIT